MRWYLLCLFGLGCAGRAPALPQAQAAQQTFSAPADARAWFLRAVTAKERGDLDEVQHSLKWVVRLDSSSPWSWLARARVEERAGLQGCGDSYLEALDLALETGNWVAAEQALRGAQDTSAHLESRRRVGRWSSDTEEGQELRARWWVEWVNP